MKKLFITFIALITGLFCGFDSYLDYVDGSLLIYGFDFFKFIVSYYLVFIYRYLSNET